MHLLLLAAALVATLGCGADAKALRGDEQASLARCTAPFGDSGELGFKTANWKTDFCKHSVPYGEIQSGGPPRDGIPPIDAPSFTTQKVADSWIRDSEPVIAFAMGGKARAYPIQILIWHEIVNDEFGGIPIAVTFCPLCYAAVVFRRPTINGKTLTFGTSGNLRNSDMVMWDRQTESWWQQFEGLAIVGELTGTQLEILPASIVSWKDFKDAFPDGAVLSRNTGVARAYGKNPYVGYDDVAKKPFLYRGNVGEGLAPMEHVVGVDRGSVARAYPVALLRKRRVLLDQLDGEAIVVMWTPGTASALDAKIIADGSDAGATGVFLSSIDGRALTFTVGRDNRVVDNETGTTWNVFGHGIDGPLEGQHLTPIAHHRVFWFSWSAFVAHRGSLFSEASAPH